MNTLLTCLDFDEADFSVADPESHPDEVVLPVPTVASTHLSNTRATNNAPPQNQTRSYTRPQQAPSRPQLPAQQTTNSNSHPQTPNSGFARSHAPSERAMPPPQNANPPQPRPAPSSGLAGPPPVIQGRTLNQPSRLGPSAPVSPARQDKDDNIESFGLPPQGAGFFSARAAAALLPSDHTTTDPSAPPPRIPNNLPAFDPHAESPSIRKTPGVDHRVSKPLAKDGKHVPASSQAAAGGAAGGLGAGGSRGLMDAQHRRIGAPNSPSPMMANKNSYKPPTMKRPVEQTRTPLLDLPANEGVSGRGDAKRPRLSE